ncbi:hypothetical protein UK23_27800 [Lentzea aerocolonigenes]|uniref:DUF1996 domain-containing protein n=1 Tax=Lentzea aerocolonigenes TaxID=68170 RepID=A0A0F0GSM2_LENAE|nr:hypothetical protein UK23_27800 [Lentzea aerocolonigenes]
MRCGTNEERHLNADNPVVSPGIPFGAHHTHEYVGNESADAMSTNISLAAAPSTCEKDDRSTYYWPVLRLTDGTGHDAHAEGGGLHGNVGEVLKPKSVEIRYEGSPVSNVLPMPRFLRMITGDPMAFTNNYGPNVRAQWGCSDQPGRFTTRYPLCGNATTLRGYDFASCWDGNNTDSASHRTHVAFPLVGGACPPRTFPIPRLRITVGYDVPPGRPFAIDSFPEEMRDPATDHAMFINVMPEALMKELVGHLNEAR